MATAKTTQSTTSSGGADTKAFGTQSPGPTPEIPSFDTADAVKQYSDEDADGGAQAPGGTSPGPKPEIPSFDTADAVKQYSDE